MTCLSNKAFHVMVSTEMYDVTQLCAADVLSVCHECHRAEVYLIIFHDARNLCLVLNRVHHISVVNFLCVEMWVAKAGHIIATTHMDRGIDVTCQLCPAADE